MMPDKEEKKEEKKLKKEEALKAEIEKLKADCDHWKNEYYRAYADTQNLRKSLEKDHREALRYRAEGFIEDLLPILDSFYMALSNEAPTPEAKNYLIGFQYIYKNLTSVLENEGVVEITPEVGKQFDASTMNAVDSIVNPELKENSVTRVYSKGYKLHDRLIRPANVQVSKKEEPKKKESSDSGEENKKENNLDA